jgi:hypothetical protein
MAAPMTPDDTFLLAKCYFDQREYDRVVHALQARYRTSSLSLFLYYYAMLLVCPDGA